MYRSVVEAVAYHAINEPNKFCIIDENSENTYEKVWKMTLKCANKYIEKNIHRGDCIVVECTQDARFIICALACQLIGAIFVPIEYKSAKDKVELIINETSANLFLYKNKIIEEEFAQCIDAFWDDINNDLEDFKDDSFNLPDEIEVSEILYTTGTTGSSRGIMLTNENNVAIAENIIYGTEMKSDSVELIPLPLSHSHGLRTAYANLVQGSTVVLINGIMNVKLIFHLIKQYRITALDLSPNAAKILLKLSKGKITEYASQIEFIQIGTAMLDEVLKENLCDLFPESRLYNFYGSTESGRVCVLDFNAVRNKVACIGKPAYHARFIVTDENRNIINSSKNNVGLLAISGKMNMKRYLGEYKLTLDVMQDGYIYTNDVGYIDDEGYVYVLGRNDDVINYKGIKIVPEEIESYVCKYKGVADCACVAVDDAVCGQIPKVYIAVDDSETFDTMPLLQYLSENIEANKMPKYIEIIEEIPRTSNGKLLRRKLRNRE